MDALKAIKMQLSKSEKLSLTENGDTAYKSTGSACLDFFSLCGAMRKNISDLVKLFTKAYAENPVIAVKILFYLRNIRGGLGERNSFRVLLKELAQSYPKTAKQLVYAVPEYGRWDDLLVLLDSPVKADVVDLIKNQLEKDWKAVTRRQRNQPAWKVASFDKHFFQEKRRFCKRAGGGSWNESC